MASYSDEALTLAVATSRSWRGVLRELGARSASSGAYRAARRHADRLSLDYTHFTGQRRWTDSQLRVAVLESTSWTEVLTKLGLSPDSSTTALRGHALRLALDTTHLAPRLPAPETAAPVPDPSQLARSGPLLAAAWFTLTGAEVSWPLEPCRYDLLAVREANVERVQVKTTTTRKGSSYQVTLRRLRSGKQPYAPEDVDSFFIVDGRLAMYSIPMAVVGGRTGLSLNAYQAFRLPPLALPA